MFYIFFILDCLITPKHEGQELRGFYVDTFCLLVLVGLERTEIEIRTDPSCCNTSENS